MSNWGLLRGLGEATSNIGQAGMTSVLQRMRDEWLANRQDARTASDRAYQEGVRKDEQAFQKGLLQERRDYEAQDDVREIKIEERDGKKVQVSYNAAGDEVMVEPYTTDQKRRWYSAGDNLFDAYAVDEDGNPIMHSTRGDGPSPEDQAQAKAILGQYSDGLSEPETEQEKAAFDWAKSVINTIPTSTLGPRPEAGAATTQPVRTAPQQAINELMNNPELADDFEAFYGYLPPGFRR